MVSWGINQLLMLGVLFGSRLRSFNVLWFIRLYLLVVSVFPEFLWDIMRLHWSRIILYWSNVCEIQWRTLCVIVSLRTNIFRSHAGHRTVLVCSAWYCWVRDKGLKGFNIIPLPRGEYYNIMMSTVVVPKYVLHICYFGRMIQYSTVHEI